MSPTFFLFGNYGQNNCGDDAMLYIILQELNKRFPKANYAILSPITVVIPDSVKHKIKLIERRPISLFHDFLDCPIFIVGGGTQFYDYGNKTERLSVLSRILLLLILAKLFSKKIYYIGIGVEPFLTTWGVFFLKSICHLADFISVRDNDSYNIVIGQNPKARVVCSFDLSALFEFIPYEGKKLSGGQIRILGVSILPFFQIYHSNNEEDSRLLEEIVFGLKQWLERDINSIIHLFIFNGGLRSNDIYISQLLIERLNSDRVRLINYAEDPKEMIYQVGCCHAFLGMRYHSCLFAYLTNTPLLVIAYFNKCRAFAKDVGLPDRSILTIEDILCGNIDQRLKEMQSDPENFIASLPVTSAKQIAQRNFLLNDII